MFSSLVKCPRISEIDELPGSGKKYLKKIFMHFGIDNLQWATQAADRKKT